VERLCWATLIEEGQMTGAAVQEINRLEDSLTQATCALDVDALDRIYASVGGNAMPRRKWTIVAGVLVACLFGVPAAAQGNAAWRDPSPHQVQFVTLDQDVRLEVLDWGGVGRPIVLLAGLGNTAHVFDDFALKLTRSGHVYGITRRGFGESSIPVSGYDHNRLGDDVLAVLESLSINRPILVGHSAAGGELSSIGSRHPDRVTGLVYLDALFSYSYTTPQESEFRAVLKKLQNDLQVMVSQPFTTLGTPASPELVTAVLNTMSDVQRQLSALPPAPAPPPSPASPTSADLASYAAFDSWFVRVRGFRVPEAELRQTGPPTPEGRVGTSRTPPSVRAAIIAGAQSFSDIRVRALALCAMPGAPADDARRTLLERRQTAFEKNVPGARVVRLPGADHYIFISNEADVLREVVAFVESLP
jgi:pimeloyl-ACP methyl ester carboxylesterase